MTAVVVAICVGGISSGIGYIWWLDRDEREKRSRGWRE